MSVSNEDGSPVVFTASGDVSTKAFIMDSLRWVGATAAGHSIVLKDGNGIEVFKSEANGANFIDGWVWKRKWMHGVEVSSMTSGTLYIYKAAN
jgi:hypothetical protein